MNPLTEVEIEVFNTFITTKYDNVCLIRSELDGEDVAVISVIDKSEDGSYNLTPVYMTIVPALFDKLAGPGSEIYMREVSADDIFE